MGGISNVTTTHIEDKEHNKEKKKKDKENIPIEDDGISNTTEDLVYEKPKKKKKKKDKAKVQDLSEFISTSNNKLENGEQLNGTSIKKKKRKLKEKDEEEELVEDVVTPIKKKK